MSYRIATLKNLRPYWGRVAVVETPVDEEETRGGIIVPVDHNGECKRGMVVALDEHWLEITASYNNGEIIPVGSIVYFKDGVKIGDTWILECNEIFAVEDPGE